MGERALRARASTRLRRRAGAHLEVRRPILIDGEGAAREDHALQPSNRLERRRLDQARKELAVDVQLCAERERVGGARAAAHDGIGRARRRSSASRRDAPRTRRTIRWLYCEPKSRIAMLS